MNLTKIEEMETEIKELRRQVDIMIKINDNANLQFDALKKLIKANSDLISLITRKI